ncbi:MAG: hypothetical protein HY791_23450 [Deltaproteobacteria bacterium]|nr:hypothetical protein [Deltaproteobacteria bacterium]
MSGAEEAIEVAWPEPEAILMAALTEGQVESLAADAPLRVDLERAVQVTWVPIHAFDLMSASPLVDPARLAEARVSHAVPGCPAGQWSDLGNRATLRIRTPLTGYQLDESGRFLRGAEISEPIWVEVPLREEGCERRRSVSFGERMQIDADDTLYGVPVGATPRFRRARFISAEAVLAATDGGLVLLRGDRAFEDTEATRFSQADLTLELGGASVLERFEVFRPTDRPVTAMALFQVPDPARRRSAVVQLEVTPDRIRYVRTATIWSDLASDVVFASDGTVFVTGRQFGNVLLAENPDAEFRERKIVGYQFETAGVTEESPPRFMAASGPGYVYTSRFDPRGSDPIEEAQVSQDAGVVSIVSAAGHGRFVGTFRSGIFKLEEAGWTPFDLHLPPAFADARCVKRSHCNERSIFPAVRTMSLEGDHLYAALEACPVGLEIRLADRCVSMIRSEDEDEERGLLSVDAFDGRVLVSGSEARLEALSE